MMNKEMLAKAVAAKKEDPGMGRPKLQRITGCTRGDAVKFLAKYGGGSRFGNRTGVGGRESVCVPVVKGGVKTLADFRNAYDKDTIVPAKVEKALAALGKDGWEYEMAFAKMCGVTLYDLGRIRDRFADHVITIGRETKRAWAGSKALAAKMREMV